MKKSELKKTINEFHKTIDKILNEGVSKTDCREETGITVGLIDSLITQVRILRKRDLDKKEIKEALLDLIADEDLEYILKYAKKQKT